MRVKLDDFLLLVLEVGKHLITLFDYYYFSAECNKRNPSRAALRNWKKSAKAAMVE
jgi:hypothetical protein